jgi:hypothetical protein
MGEEKKEGRGEEMGKEKKEGKYREKEFREKRE